MQESDDGDGFGYSVERGNLSEVGAWVLVNTDHCYFWLLKRRRDDGVGRRMSQLRK